MNKLVAYSTLAFTLLITGFHPLPAADDPAEARREAWKIEEKIQEAKREAWRQEAKRQEDARQRARDDAARRDYYRR